MIKWEVFVLERDMQALDHRSQEYIANGGDYVENSVCCRKVSLSNVDNEHSEFVLAFMITN